MKAPRRQIAELIAGRSLGKKLTGKQITEIAAYLLEEGRVSELSSLMRDVQSLWADKGYVEVIATSAHELSPQVIRDIEAEARRIYPDAKRIVVTPKLDPALVGGVQLAITDYRLDASVAGELQKFKMLAAQGKDL